VKLGNATRKAKELTNKYKEKKDVEKDPKNYSHSYLRLSFTVFALPTN